MLFGATSRLGPPFRLVEQDQSRLETEAEPGGKGGQNHQPHLDACTSNARTATRCEICNGSTWNFAYPYKLKQLIDLVAQRNMLFTFDAREYGPLLKTPRALVILARGGAYAEDLPTPPSRFDHQKSYFEFWLPFIGVREVETLVVESTSWGGEEKGKYSVERGKEAARELATHFRTIR
jgi:hypothetical protein